MSIEIPPHEPCPVHQADSVTIIATPVSGQKYEWRAGEAGSGASLGAQKNVRILSVEAHLTWGVTQPTPLEVHLAIDENAIKFAKADPVSGQNYLGVIEVHTLDMAFHAMTGGGDEKNRAFLLEGRSVKLEIEITWATTQPTNLTMRVKWAKW